MPPEDTGTLADAIRAATARLAETSKTPRLDAELLMAHALGVSREAMLLGGLDTKGPFVPSAVEGPGTCASTALGTNGVFEALVERRAAGEPLAYIVGHRDFWDMTLAVGPGVLIPRPDSETLIEAAIAHFRGGAGPRRILDLGTGSGALLLAALRVWSQATGIGIDRSEAALAIASANAAALGLAGRAVIQSGGWGGTGETFDLILCNPPYVALDEPLPRDVAEHEPAGALYAGADGLDDYRALVPLLVRQLVPGGVACLEIGATQADAVSALARDCGLGASVRRDLAGHDRCIVATR